MSMQMKPILGINYYFSPCDYNDAAFRDERRSEPVACFVQNFKRWMEERYDVEVHTYDCVDVASDDVKVVLYFDYNWKYARKDMLLQRIPFEKRALMIIEPANINPSLYYLSRYRNRFSTIFTWDRKLLSKYPHYKPVNVPVGAEPSSYRDNRFREISFDEKKLLIAVSRNRWAYMPQSTYRLRKAAYRYFEVNCKDEFDLYGQGWNKPVTAFEKWFGFHWFSCFRGEIPASFEAKVSRMAHYKFALCYENNASQPGYVSEKITDCFCARCVPIYYGSPGVEEMIPQDCWINARQFKNFREMQDFIVNMTPERHAEYLAAMDDFMHSSKLEFFSTNHYFTTLAEGLGFNKKRPLP